MKLFKLLTLLALLLPASIAADDFTIGNKTFLLNGEPFIVKAAEVHYPRIPRPYWEHRIKMCKALGMNTLCIYVFWNYHEQQQDQFNFEGQADVAEFCRLAQKNGMCVIVRPGPYACAEWEMGGLPWWLLKKKDIKLREQDPFFMERAKIFEEKLAEQLRPFAIYNGGPIIMVQVENEYGSYGEDKPYMSAMRDIVRGAWGKEMALFQCDWSSNFWKNGLDDLTWTMNFGTGATIDEQFRRLGEMRPDAPKMCSEFWSGWFDKWGAQHETRPAKDMVAGMDEMLSKGISFSLYMTHGGTSFGHWAGANSPGFAPDVTSYDYDAPINEYGQATPKYWELRKMMEKYNDGKKMPAVPKAPMPIITVPKLELTEFAPLYNGFDYRYTWWDHEEEAHGDRPKTFEELDLGWGAVLYTTRLPEIPQSGEHLSAAQSTLTLDAHDFAQVFIDGKYMGKIDRVKNEKTLTLPAIKQGQELQILVEGMGRINFGRAIKDFKGIIGKPTITTSLRSHLGGVDKTDITYTPSQWECVRIPDDYEVAVQAFKWQKGELKGHEPTTHESLNQPVIGRGFRIAKESDELIFGRGYYRGYFDLKKVGDTFLNFETWGKGQVWVNGHAMGRIWSIGPQQTLYVPGCWLKKGKNEVIVLDIVGPEQAVTWGQAEPELNKLQLEKSSKHNNPGDKPDLNSKAPAIEGEFKAGNGWQKVMCKWTRKGRYLAIEVQSTQAENDVAAIAEIYVIGDEGKRLSREPWTVKYASSEEENGNHLGDKVFDLQESTYWQTVKGTDLPHLLVIDLGSEQIVNGIEYLPRAEQGAPGSIKKFRVFLY